MKTMIAIIMATLMLSSCGLEYEQCEESVQVREWNNTKKRWEEFTAFRIVEC
jgi:protein involved in sex pheromone biosynthesis